MGRPLERCRERLGVSHPVLLGAPFCGIAGAGWKSTGGRAIRPLKILPDLSVNRSWGRSAYKGGSAPSSALWRRARERLAPVAAILTATSEAAFIAMLRSRAALLHTPGSREILLLSLRPRSEVLLHLATEVGLPGLPRRKAALRLLLRRRKITLLVLAVKLAALLLGSETALGGGQHCRSRIVPVPFAIAAREVRPVTLEPPLFEARSRWPVRPY